MSFSPKTVFFATPLLGTSPFRQQFIRHYPNWSLFS